MRAILFSVLLSGCLDYEALSKHARDDLSAALDLGPADSDGAPIYDFAGEDLSLVPPDLTVVDLVGADLAGQDLATHDATVVKGPPQLIGADAHASFAQTTNFLARPTGTEQNDVILLLIWWTSTTAEPTITSSSNGGSNLFTQLASIQYGVAQSARWYWRRADTTDPIAAYTVTFGQVVDSAVMMIVFRGASGVVASTASVMQSGDWPLSVTTTVPNTALVPMLGHNMDDGGWTAPTGFSTLPGATSRSVAFLANVPTPQPVSISRPKPVNAVSNLLTDVVLVQP